MRKKYIFGKKLYISILTMIVVLLTTVATTFAWVGVFANSTFDTFEFDIKSSSLEEYGIEVSLTGEDGTFSDSIGSDEIKKAILLNWGYSESFINQSNIDDLFTTLNMEQCTTVPTTNASGLVAFGDFKDIEGNPTKAYYSFDLYVSAVKYYETGSTSNFALDVFLNKGLITGNYKRKLLTNPFTYPDHFINPLESSTLPENLTAVLASTKITYPRVNSKSVCRVGFEKYAVVDKYHPEQYTSSSLPQAAIIYTGDSYDYATYDSNMEAYEFGGILEDDLNLAVGYYNSTEWWYSRAGIKTISVSDSSADIYAGDVYTIRGVGGTHPDKIFTSNTNHLIDSLNSSEKIGINKMMKVRVSFWIEGWDADCFNAIGGSPVTLSISMSIKNEEEF